MTLCFYAVACLCIIVAQTTILPHLLLFDKFYDLLCPFVVYLIFFRPVAESIFVIFCLGFIMDNLSGGPFGLYLIAYCWIFIIMKQLVKFLNMDNAILVSLLVALSVFIENIILTTTIAVTKTNSHESASAANIITMQILWAVCTGHFFVTFLKGAHNKWNAAVISLFSERNLD